MRVTDLGELGTIGAILRPITLTLERDTGQIWDLTGYTSPTITVREVRTKTPVAVNGSIAITDAANGQVTYTPGTADPIAATAGTFEARITVDQGAGDPEPSGLFRFTIAG